MCYDLEQAKKLKCFIVLLFWYSLKIRTCPILKVRACYVASERELSTVGRARRLLPAQRLS